MTSEVGKSKDGEVWFKSDQQLININNAYRFEVTCYKEFFFFGEKSYKLYAVYRFLSWDDHTRKEYEHDSHKLIGIYETAEDASHGLSLAMDALGIKNIWVTP